MKILVRLFKNCNTRYFPAGLSPGKLFKNTGLLQKNIGAEKILLQAILVLRRHKIAAVQIFLK